MKKPGSVENEIAQLKNTDTRKVHDPLQGSQDIPWRDPLTGVSNQTRTGFFMIRMDATLAPPEYSKPHRHDFQEILIIQSGQARHIIDGQTVYMLPQSVCFVAKDHVHIVEQHAGLTGWTVRFTDDFLPAEFISHNWNYRLTLFNQIGATRTLELQPHEMRRLELVLNHIESEYSHAGIYQEETLRHLLSLLIIQLGRARHNSGSVDRHEGGETQIFQKFMNLLEHDFTRHHNVQHYAEALNIDPLNLSNILNRMQGKSTKRLIEERVILEAKRHLLYSGLCIKEVAVSLGYTDQFHFSKTFKRLVGIPPQAFRELSLSRMVIPSPDEGI